MSPQESTLQDSSLQEPLIVVSETSRGSSGYSDRHGDSDERKNIVVPASCLTCGRRISLNHNVWLNLISCALYGIGASLSNGTAYAAYLKRIGNDLNSPLGDIEALGGLASLVSALPVGYLADRHGRSKVIRSGGILLLLVSAFQICVMEWIKQDGGTRAINNSKTALSLLGVIMAGFGICDGIVNGPSQALYADSTPQGQRSVYYTYLFSCYAISSCVGPLVSIAMFQAIGDDWDLFHLKLVIYVGLGFGILNGVTMLLFDDSKALDEQETESTVPVGSNCVGNGNDNEPDSQQRLAASTDERDRIERGETRTSIAEGDTSVVDEAELSLRKRQAWIPYILFLSGLIMSTGSGMTVKFFPLFFKDEVGMTPSQVQLIYVCVPLSMTGFSYVCSGLAASGFGRVQSSLLMGVLGICCLFSMVVFKPYMDNHPAVLVPIYILRTGLMNCSYPLVESILMDFVPKEERARWKSLESVAAFGWCGSAALGGWLADKYDYTYTFLITALLQTFGYLVFSSLIPLVPRQEGAGGPSNQRFSRDGGDSAGNRTGETTQVDPVADGRSLQPLSTQAQSIAEVNPMTGAGPHLTVKQSTSSTLEGESIAETCPSCSGTDLTGGTDSLRQPLLDDNL